jgi:ubiquinone/menaquinone biosynthesis C-methylase UbiE
VNDFETEPASCVICGETAGRPEATGRDYVYRGSTQTCTAWRCAGCGHVYLNPRPAPTAISVLYPPHYASFSGKYTEGNRLLSRMKERVMLGRIEKLLRRIPPGGRVLDIGCGDGQLLEAISRRFPHLEVHGLDWRFDETVRARLERQGIALHESRLETADLPPGHFDLVTMNQLIEHLWEPREGLALVRRILKPQGRLALATPDVDGYDRRLFAAGLWGGYYFPRHLNLFSRASLRRLLSECGFDVEESRSLVAPVVWCYSLKAAAQTRFPSRRWLGDACDVHNIPMMAAFTALDMAAVVLRVPTSNQSVVARPAAQADPIGA